MPINHLRLGAVAAALALLAVSSEPSFAQKKYDTGATDTEIKIGNIMRGWHSRRAARASARRSSPAANSR